MLRQAHPGLGTVDDKSFAIRADTLKMNAPALNNIKAAGPRALTKDRIPCGPRQRTQGGGRYEIIGFRHHMIQIIFQGPIRY